MSDGARKVCSDCAYNLNKQLTKKLQFLHYVDSYIEDAERDGDVELVSLWSELKEDTQRHAEKLKSVMVSRAKEGKL